MDTWLLPNVRRKPTPICAIISFYTTGLTMVFFYFEPNGAYSVFVVYLYNIHSAIYRPSDQLTTITYGHFFLLWVIPIMARFLQTSVRPGFFCLWFFFCMGTCSLSEQGSFFYGNMFFKLTKFFFCMGTCSLRKHCSFLYGNMFFTYTRFFFVWEHVPYVNNVLFFYGNMFFT